MCILASLLSSSRLLYIYRLTNNTQLHRKKISTLIISIMQLLLPTLYLYTYFYVPKMWLDIDELELYGSKQTNDCYCFWHKIIFLLQYVCLNLFFVCLIMLMCIYAYACICPVYFELNVWLAALMYLHNSK